MNLGYWGVQVPRSDTIDGPARALPVMDLGPMIFQHVAGTQVIDIADSDVDTLTIPTDAVYAMIQVNGCAAWYTTTGADPTIASVIGFKVADQTIIEIFGRPALALFKIRAHTGGTGKIYVEYKKYKLDIS